MWCRLAAVLNRAGATDSRPIEGKFNVDVACKDDRLLVVSHAQPEEEERKGHMVEVRENNSKQWPTALEEEERSCRYDGCQKSA